MKNTLKTNSVYFDPNPVKYIPALGFNSLTPFFDTLQKWIVRETTFKPQLLSQAFKTKKFKLLDLGCGTGTLTILAKKTNPSIDVTGIDIDPTALNIAKKKKNQAGTQINFDLATAFDLPYPDNSFDIVVSSLVFHHLTKKNKIKTLKEVLRILKTKGEIHIADIGKPQNFLMRLPSALMRHFEEIEDNVKGLIPQMLKLAGFEEVKETIQVMTLFGTVTLITAQKP